MLTITDGRQDVSTWPVPLGRSGDHRLDHDRTPGPWAPRTHPIGRRCGRCCSALGPQAPWSVTSGSQGMLARDLLLLPVVRAVQLGMGPVDGLRAVLLHRQVQGISEDEHAVVLGAARLAGGLL